MKSFEKGELFEKYVEEVLFPDSEYDLIHRTNNYKQNKDRISLDTLKPDFKFKCKRTNIEFYVEAKYRSNFNWEDMLDIMRYNQYERFLKIEKDEKIEIFIAIGYQGEPNNPKNISFIPLKKLKHFTLYHSFLLKFDIEKKAIDITNYFGKEIISIKETKENIEKNNLKKRKKFNKTIFSSIVVVVFLILVNYGYDYHKKTKIENGIRTYYSIIRKKEINRLDEVVSPFVYRWFNDENLSINEIKKKAKEYNLKYNLTNIEIHWNTLKIEKNDDGNYVANYDVDYYVFKTKKSYKLKMTSVWNSNYKMTRLSEIIVDQR
ncbi:hypothetical protein [Flavobacterium sp.]|uniref:hypothetical protein n=1 Tax=Flavobacterium sp. TaxID=239 RepID=UPI00352908C3